MAAATQRIDLRLKPEAKQIISEAADAMGVSISNFVTSCVLEKARRVIQERDVIRLSSRDHDAFMEAINNPAPPNEKLIKAVKNYRERGFT
ncbi:MAG: DUF1778 domain-containing protein [Magnetococcales bacterium]|nr:DUF1778 domain-containing protein [Magnetococcales bacterium]